MSDNPASSLLLRALVAAEHGLDALKARLGPERTPVIVPFRGHATERTVHVKGRVLEDPGTTPATDADSWFDNAAGMVQRFESDEIPGAQVEVVAFGQSCTVETDEEGYFRCHLTLDAPVPTDARVHPVYFNLKGTPRNPDARAHAEGQILAALPTAQFAVISDIDDTVLVTGAARMTAMLRTTLFSNARTRLPFQGVAAFYRALAYGTSSTMDNPVFYLSSSPWNLYDLLTEFFDLQGLPVGPLFLRDLGLTKEHLIKSPHDVHKNAVIDDLVTTHASLPFVLIGDSGQHDPEIYAEAVERHPGRIRAVYIRDVTDERRDATVRECVARMEAHGVDVAFFEDSLAAARYAARHGLISEARLPDVEAEFAKDVSGEPGTTAEPVGGEEGGGEKGERRSGGAEQ